MNLDILPTLVYDKNTHYHINIREDFLCVTMNCVPRFFPN